jgi:hypothetical protein
MDVSTNIQNSNQAIDLTSYHHLDHGNDKEKESDKGSDTTDIALLNNETEWSPEHEVILVEWADKAMCYRWLHSKANALYAYLNALYTIPVIIISTLTGTANFAQQRVPTEYQALFMMTVGGFNLFAGIVTTIQQFLKITQLNEAHRVSSIAWDKFYRNIKIELAKHPKERLDVKQMIKMSKEEFDRLMETSPSIPEKIINNFKKNFVNHNEFNDIVKPEICDILIPTDKYRNPWYHDENREKETTENIKIQLIKQNKLRKIKEKNSKLIKDFITSFMNLNNREPMEAEIIDNLKDKLDINSIKKILEDSKLLVFRTSENDVVNSV